MPASMGVSCVQLSGRMHLRGKTVSFVAVLPCLELCVVAGRGQNPLLAVYLFLYIIFMLSSRRAGFRRRLSFYQRDLLALCLVSKRVCAIFVICQAIGLLRGYFSRFLVALCLVCNAFNRFMLCRIDILCKRDFRAEKILRSMRFLLALYFVYGNLFLSQAGF